MGRSGNSTKTGFRMLAPVLAAAFAVLCLSGCSKEFKTNSVVNLAKKNGMDQISITEMERRWGGGELTETEYLQTQTPAYYVSENSNEANSFYAKHLKLGSTDIPGLEELVICEGSDDTFGTILMRTVSEESAKKIYQEWSEYFKGDNDVCYSGSNSGYDYTIAYGKKQAETVTEEIGGVYIKGRTVIVLSARIGAGNDRKMLDSFSRSLGLVLPEEVGK